MPLNPVTLEEIHTVLTKATSKIDDMIRRVEKNEDNIGKLWKANNDHAVQIAKQQQWTADHEKREFFILSVITVLLTGMIWLSGWILR